MADVISVVEACYDLDCSEANWLAGIAQTAVDVAGRKRGVLAYHLDTLDDGGLQVRHPTAAGGVLDGVNLLEGFGDLQSKLTEHGLVGRIRTKAFEQGWKALSSRPVTAMTLGEVLPRIGPWVRGVWTLGAPGVRDVLILRCPHIDRNGLTALAVPYETDHFPTDAQRRRWLMLGAHVQAGLRLRRLLDTAFTNGGPGDDDAVLNPDGAVVHAEGSAREQAKRERLRHAAREIDRARSKRGGRTDEALAAWQGLVDGTWSLVDHFDRDGKRYLIARKNRAEVRDPRGLSEQEVRTLAHAVRGLPNKLIGYHLGISESTIATHLSTALRKLGIHSRTEAVRVLSRQYPAKPFKPS